MVRQRLKKKKKSVETVSKADAMKAPKQVL
jgi:hypothetical protein